LQKKVWDRASTVFVKTNHAAEKKFIVSLGENFDLSKTLWKEELPTLTKLGAEAPPLVQ
jgi:hypothetical protein